MPSRVITDSSLLETVPPANTGVDNSYTIHSPSQHANWAALWAAKPPVPGLHYKFKRGDYKSWGPYTFTNGDVAGTALDRIMLRYDDADVELHPVARKAAANEAVFDALRWNGSNQRSWMTHGLTIREPTLDTDILLAAGDIVHDYLLVEDSSRNHGYRIRSGVGNVFQRFVIRNKVNYGTGAGDIGIQVVVQSTPVTGTKILDGEIYGYGDGFQASHNNGDPAMAADGIIEGCDFYPGADRYYNGGANANAENALDFKCGNDAVPWIVRKCNMWGYRAGGEASGQAIVVHVYGRNIIIEDCNIGDSPIGIVVNRWGGGGTPIPSPLGQNTPRNIIVRRNWFHDIQPYDPVPTGAGAVWHTTNNELFQDNYIARSYGLIYVANALLDAGGPVFTGNTRIGTPTYHPGTLMSPYTEGTNFTATAPYGYYSYQRRRWTGIEAVSGAEPAPQEAFSNGASARSRGDVGPVSWQDRRG